MSADRPNIVYILADDMGFGDLHANNADSRIPTPNLDRLAAEGMRFTDAHAASSVCTPSRYALLTGRYCWRTPLKSHVLWPWDPALIEPDTLTAPQLLRENGYRTACIGKWHLGWNWPTKDGKPAHGDLAMGDTQFARRVELEANIDYTRPIPGGPVDCGFDDYFGVDVPNFAPYTWFENDRLTDMPTEDLPPDMFGQPGKMMPGWSMEAMIPELTRRSVDYIENADEDPFFLYLALTSPHTPIVPNQPFLGKSGAGLYGDFVCEVDWVVGQVLDALDRKGIAQDTLVIFTSDNGPECVDAAAGGTYHHAREFGHYSMGELRGVKRDTWEGGHRVPFVARWPGKTPAGSVCNGLTMLGDLTATCADLLGVELPPGQAPDSITALPLLLDPDAPPRRDHLVHHACFGHFGIRKDHWVFIDNPTGDDNIAMGGEPAWFKDQRGYVPHDQPGELFDLRTDLSERHNLYAQHPEVVAELKELLESIKDGDHLSSNRDPIASE